MRVSKLIAAGVCVSLLALVVGCGSSGSSSSAPPVTVTQTTTTPAPAKTQAPATTQSSTSSGGGGGQTVPGDVVGKKLDDAEDELDSKGIQYSVDSGSHVVILRGDWGVCSTTPGSGQSISGAVVLHVGHFSCGAD